MKVTVQRRFITHKPAGNPWTLASDHVAAVEGRTRYPATRKSALDVRRVLKSGKESRKIGDRISKGKWCGFPIFTLTLEERATCPRTCKEWLTCYGNKMHWSHRFTPNAETMNAIELELMALQVRYPGGFAVRLHVLGDFVSPRYVDRWRGWLDQFAALHVFGYTAHRRSSVIGKILEDMSRNNWGRFAVRFSHDASERGCVVVDSPEEALDAIVCPAQTDKTDCCGTCGLCWNTKKQIAFLRH